MATSSTPTAASWLEAYASELELAVPTEQEITDLLDMAGVAAHASERIAAPISCWLAARAGVTPLEALEAARRVAGQLERP